VNSERAGFCTTYLPSLIISEQREIEPYTRREKTQNSDAVSGGSTIGYTILCNLSMTPNRKFFSIRRLSGKI
jgi:hypothetical protein